VKKSLAVKLTVGACALALFGLLFMRSLDDARATPYAVDRQQLRSWTLALESGTRQNDPLLVLRPVPELASGLFRQVFSRAMESLSAPASSAIPLVLHGEYDRVIADQITQEVLLDAARAAGLESAAVSPKCLVHRRVSEPGGVRQVFFAVFDVPGAAQFRRQLGLDPDALSAVLFVGGAGPDFNAWLPQRVNLETDCLAPIEITE